MTRLLAITLVGLAGAARADDGVAFFEARVRPVLVEKCYGCHGADKQKGGLRLDSRDALRTGGDSGPAIVPGKPDESRLVRAIRHADKSLKMPPDKKLPAEQVADLERWVAQGVEAEPALLLVGPVAAGRTSRPGRGGRGLEEGNAVVGASGAAEPERE